MKLRSIAGLCAGLTLAVTTLAHAETRVTYKAAKAGTSYYQMAVQIGEAVKEASSGKIIVTVEESQGSVQNVMEAAVRGEHYMFTSPPSLVDKAVAGAKPFDPADAATFGKIRALFPIPSLTMHYVVRNDAGVNTFADLAGKRFVIGKGSFGATEAAKNFKQFGLEGKVELIDIELSGAGAAMKNRQVDGFATAGSWPAPNVVEVAASAPVKLLSMSDAQVKGTGQSRIVIPKGTYPGMTEDVVTTSLPVIAYALTDMDEATAYELTRSYWKGLAAMAKTNPWWNGVTATLLDNISVKLHPGALKYYAEAGMTVPERLK